MLKVRNVCVNHYHIEHHCLSGIAMLKLIVDPVVYSALKQAFPTPAKSAEKAIAKYIGELAGMLEHAFVHHNSPFDNRFNLFSISLHALANKGPQIGTHKIRLHKWLRENQLELVETVEVGTKFNGQVSKVKLSDRVKLEIQTGALDAKAEFDKTHPNFATLSQQQIDADYHVVALDLESLQNYINQLSPTGIAPKRYKDKPAYFLAKKIHAQASYKNGQFYQKKKPSPFGRTYYEGLSVQNVNKALRAAMLGDAWEYDIRSSVVTWKLGYAQSYINNHSLTGTVAQVFPHCHQYSIDKKVMIDVIRQQVFLSSGYSATEQRELIKQSLTALNFGAKLVATGYMNKFGDYEFPALKQIIKDPVELNAFINCKEVVDFVQEQKQLDPIILAEARTHNLKYQNSQHLFKTNGGSFSRQKAMSYLYQNFETTIMDLVRNECQRNHIEVLANIHDAIVVRTKLNARLKKQIESAMRSSTHNIFWHLDPKQINRTQ